MTKGLLNYWLSKGSCGEAAGKKGSDLDYDPFIVLPNDILRIQHYTPAYDPDGFPTRKRVSYYLTINPVENNGLPAFEVNEKRPAPKRY